MGESVLRERVANWISGVLLVLVLIGGVALVFPTYQRRQGLCARRAELMQRIEKRRAEIEAVKTMQRRFSSDPDFVEQIARQNRRVYPGELVFQFERE